jgi:SpoIID/LytB domain protein
VRLSWARLLVPLWVKALCAADIAPHFAGRTGSALLWDLERDVLAGNWNEARAGSVELKPGSLLKAFTFAALLESGTYDAARKVQCTEGALEGEAALAYSCNEYFDDVARRLGAEELTRGYARFGLQYGKPSAKLRELLPAWKRLVARHREARLAPLFRGLRKAVEFGTARYAGAGSVAVAGKTGTMRDTALFAGFAPAEKPKYLLLIHLDGGSGGGDAAPLAGKVFGALFPALRSAFDPSRVDVALFWRNTPRQLNLAPGEYVEGTEIVTGQTRMRAPGPIIVRREADGYSVRARVALEDYVEAVLHGEAGGFRHAASRQAQAVAARTYAARFRGRHAEEGFDFCDTTHCQDARFVMRARLELREAVGATSGELLWRAGKPVDAFYHADSGGWLEEPSRRDGWWKAEANALWEWRVKATDLAAALGLTFVTQEFRVMQREKSGRARALDAFGHPAEGTAFRTAVGRAMGWEKLPSRLFEVERRERELVFRGRGRGHGIGMAQTSAERMAAAGKNYREILSEYYPGARVGLSARGLAWRVLREGKVTMYSTQAARDGALLALAARELARLEKELGMSVAPTIRVYPTGEAFRDATGNTDRVHGTARGSLLRFISGANAVTVRHELLHALLETNTRVRHPMWFREGLVEALNGEGGADAEKVKTLLREQGLSKVLHHWQTGLPTGFQN